MTATASLPRHDAALGRETWLVSGVVVLGAIMSILDTTIVNIALATLSRDLHSPLTTIQWASTGYLLSLAMVIPLAGWLSERFGSRRVWLLSVAAFGAGSALCGFSGSAGMLIAFRVLQGFGGGLIMPVGMSVLAQTAGPQRIGRVMSVIGVPMLLGPVLGPLLGGLIVSNASWRWIFYVNVPIAIAGLLLAARILRRDIGRADAGRLDWTGLALLSPGLAAIVFGLSETESQGGIGSATAFGPFLAGVALVFLFVRHARAAARPLIDVRLFRSLHFSAAAATTFAVGAAMFGSLLVLPLFEQVARGQSALAAGLLLAPQGVGAALAMPLAGRLADRYGGGRVAIFGCCVLALATLPLVFVRPGTPVALLHVVLAVRGVGVGAAMMPVMAAAYSRLRSDQVPRATSALNALQRTGGSIGTALIAVVLQRQLRELPGGHAVGLGSAIPPGVREQIAGPLTAAFAHTFAWAVGLAVVAVAPAVVLALAERSTGAEA
jgi:EmrB/QacA subfamily drug resistance transporter